MRQEPRTRRPGALLYRVAQALNFSPPKRNSVEPPRKLKKSLSVSSFLLRDAKAAAFVEEKMGDRQQSRDWGCQVRSPLILQSPIFLVMLAFYANYLVCDQLGIRKTTELPARRTTVWTRGSRRASRQR